MDRNISIWMSCVIRMVHALEVHRPAVRANCETGNQAFSMRLGLLTITGFSPQRREWPSPLLLSLKVKTVAFFLLLTISRRGVFFLLGLRGNPTMADKPSDLVQGTLDMLILKTLALEPMHGYGIAVRLEQMSKGVFRLNAGSLFVAFQRLQRDGLIKSEWKATENSRRAKYYVLTEQGRKRLNSETREWGRQVAAIARILEAS